MGAASACFSQDVAIFPSLGSHKLGVIGSCVPPRGTK